MRLLVLLFLTSLWVCASLRGQTSASAPLAVGSELTQVEIRGQVYRQVKIRKLDADRVLLETPTGLLSVEWKHLPTSWRTALQHAIPPPSPTPKVRVTPPPSAVERKPLREASPSEETRESDEALALRDVVDFRPKIRELGLWVRNQGRRPSCSIYALVSAIEYAYAQRTGHSVRLDEDHLIRATAGLTGRPLRADGNDPGYSLADVLRAIDQAGARVSSSDTEENDETTPATFLPTAQCLRLYPISRSRPAEELDALIAGLNAGLPIALGLRWPPAYGTQGGLLDTQEPDPNYRHAVTLVGYECPTGKKEDLVFLFKNSWGPQWGSTGFGRVSARYLARNFLVGLVVGWEAPVNPP